MIEQLDFKKLQRFGITENFIIQFNKMMIEFTNQTIPKNITKNTIIFSDLHANLPALEMIINFAEEHEIKSFISLGDLIEYNNYNNEVLNLIQANTNNFISNLKGNHDDGTIHDNKFISNMFHEIIDKDLGNILLNLPQIDMIKINDKKILLCHSNPWNVDIIYLFPESTNFLEYFLDKLPCDGFMFGHTHILTWYKSIKSNKLAFNPGSLGVSRDGSQTLYFSVSKPKEQKIEIFEIKHDKQDYSKLLSEKPIKTTEYFL